MNRPIHFSPTLEVLRAEIVTYLRELPRLLAEGQEGRFALIKGDQLLSIWDTFDDACQAGHELFPMGTVFLAQPIEARYLNCPWPEQYLPRKAT
jgi:hypothetical protein